MIVSESYSIPTAKYVKILFSDILSNYLFGILAVVMLLIILMVIDIRWFFVLLMAIFIIFPMLVAYLYIWHCFKPETRLSLMSKYLEITERKITLVFDAEKQTELYWNEFIECRLTKEYYIFTFKKSKYLYFMIPVNDIGDIKCVIPSNIVFIENN